MSLFANLFFPFFRFPPVCIATNLKRRPAEKKYSLEIVATQKIVKWKKNDKKIVNSSAFEDLNSESTKGFHLKLIIKLVFIILGGSFVLVLNGKKEKWSKNLR